MVKKAITLVATVALVGVTAATAFAAEATPAKVDSPKAAYKQEVGVKVLGNGISADATATDEGIHDEKGVAALGNGIDQYATGADTQAK